ncbi:MAG: PhzF family phenazine biosynthesis protein [Phycisphaerae bacterium]
MANTVQFRLVDAFAERAYTGNPAGVILDADDLDEKQMQAIAREVNASETAFIIGANDLHRTPRLRWFTPTVEVDFCGHATLAAAHAWSEVVGFRALLGKSDAKIEFETAAGLLRLTPELASGEEDRLIWWLAMPDPSLKPDNTNPMKMTRLLGITMDDLEPAAPIMRTRDDAVILLIKSWRALAEMKPNFQELAALSERHNIRGFCVATRETLSDFAHVASRFFAPALGINEDPVTGSVHGPLAVLLTVNELVPMTRGRAALNCLQGQPGGRTGLVRALVEATAEGYRVSIGGMSHTTVRGELRVPSKSG